VAARIPNQIALQGNLDPHVLFAGAEVIRDRATAIMRSVADRPGHIMNLGHGILPDTPIASVEALIEAVHAYDRSSVGEASWAT
jgi:uroporphyrinogen decarboxylase